MRTELDVVNACLATMGERPINALTDPHPWRAAAQAKLSESSKKIQGRGWWFNLEYLEIIPNIVDSFLYLPSDALDVRTGNKNYIFRDGRIFNLDGGVYVFPAPIKVEVVREIPFEDLPQPAQDYIEARTIMRFQMDYDADSTKTRQHQADYTDARVAFNKAATVAASANMIDNNVSLARIKYLTRNVRPWRGYN